MDRDKTIVVVDNGSLDRTGEASERPTAEGFTNRDSPVTRKG